uniref:Uncharacterized protein n=1 Tax=Romanomermis culicivorax TaxID=13658 RepID=A0A915JPV7_ROMCU
MMASPDFIDAVLGIGSDLNNQVFARAFDDFGKRHFGTNGLEFNSAKFIYMLYSAILTLPLTQKLGQHQIDAVMVVKRVQDLNLAISYATNDGSLSLKIIRFDGSFPPIKSITVRSGFFDMQEILASVKGRKLDSRELDSAARELHYVSFQHRSDQTSFDIIPEISRVPFDPGHTLVRQADFPKPLKIQQSEFAKSAKIFVEQLQSNNYDVVKYNIHALIRLLTMQHHIQAPFAELLVNSINDYHLFLIAALKMNWASSCRLNVQPIIEQHKKVIYGIMINHIPEDRVWKSEPIKSVVQLLTSARLSSHELNVERMYENIVKWVPISGSRIIAVGIDHQKLIDAVTEWVDIPSFELMTYTHLLDLNPWENLVDLLLKPFNFVDQSNRHRIKYCIENLNQMGRYGLHTYLYGQLMSYRDDLDKNVYYKDDGRKEWTRFVFKIRGKKAGVIFDIFHRKSYRGSGGYAKAMPIRDPKLVNYLHVTVYQVVRSMEDNLLNAELRQIDVRFIEQLDGPPVEELSENELYSIPSANPEDILTTLEKRPEQEPIV